jgi:phosphatidate phosphatase APP1
MPRHAADWQRLLQGAGHGIEQAVDALRQRHKRRTGYASPIAIQPFRGYGTSRRVRIIARVLEDRGLPAPTPDDSAWVNLRRMLRMLESDEVPGAQVKACFAGQEQRATADAEGYVACEFVAGKGPGGFFAPGTHEVTFDLLEPLAREQPVTRFRGEVFIPRVDASWIVVSDIDDTVMHTQATSLLKMAAGTLFTNAYGRIAFPGIAAFYRALHKAAGGRDGANPLFYLTSSPWNLYDLIKTFLEIHGLPAGPLLMRDLGFGPSQHLRGGHEHHKLARALELLDLYPDQRFILIGDTGQHDPEIFLKVCGRAPGRILAVYLRDVSDDARRDLAIAGIVQQIRDLGIPCVADADTVAHAEHAARQGWITSDDLQAVRGGKRKDEREGAG